MINELIKSFTVRSKAYFSMIKIWQTGLLLVTGLTGYLSVSHEKVTWQMIFILLSTLFLSISGSTVLNMVYDNDIDHVMQRTYRRPIPSGIIRKKEGLILGVVLSFLGVLWSFITFSLYGLIVLAGLMFDMLYTLRLKRKTAWSIILGGIAGGMPVFAGRTLAVGEVDLVGIILALAVVFWIPTHIVTFAIKYAHDYEKANVPVLPNIHGITFSHRFVTVSTALSALLIITVSWIVGLSGACMAIVICLGLLLLILSVISMIRQFARLDFVLFKAASIYMLASSVLIVVGVQLV